ncbi:aspartate aminotransferase family protein [Pseudomaricurvus alkylphenolicus]|uniref:aspartate aminotransferase family protein n=1 Tax=Pseudomaricurvus alkylphenolicus TaxID=1306991 RepID=UPI0030B8CA0A
MNSESFLDRAKRVIPGGIQSNYRKGALAPVYFKSANGVRLRTVEGQEFIDYNLGSGPAILGYENRHLTHAIESQNRELFNAMTSEVQVLAAEKIVEHVPCADQVRFCVTGTEANANALRIARAYTGRDKFVHFLGHYHGSTDEFVGGIVKDPSNPIACAGQIEGDVDSMFTNTEGRKTHALEGKYRVQWNDLPALEELLAGYGDEIAAIMMEPSMTNWFGCLPEQGYLEGVRKLCDKYGIVLIFDEIVTGFRMDIGGAQQRFGVIPDMCTLAKGVAGGIPVAVVCGKQNIMQKLVDNDVLIAGTYNGYAQGMAAVIATIEELERDNGAIYQSIEKHGNLLREGVLDIAQELGMDDLRIQGFPACWNYFFHPKEKTINYADSLDGWGNGMTKAARFVELMLENGVFTWTRFYTSAGHTEKEVNDALDRIRDSLKQLKSENL